MKLKPLGARAMVKPVEREQTTESGIVLPDTAQEKPQNAEVVAVGYATADGTALAGSDYRARTGTLVFTAGQVAEANAGRDVGSQTKEILGGIDALLARAGTDKSRIVAVNIWLAHIGDFDTMNAVYDAWVDKANPPVRACRFGPRRAQPAASLPVTTP